jgi:lysophospholipid acyltransferase (LPLAT)-like uncharacterized protein
MAQAMGFTNVKSLDRVTNTSFTLDAPPATKNVIGYGTTIADITAKKEELAMISNLRAALERALANVQTKSWDQMTNTEKLASLRRADEQPTSPIASLAIRQRCPR